MPFIIEPSCTVFINSLAPIYNPSKEMSFTSLKFDMVISFVDVKWLENIALSAAPGTPFGVHADSLSHETFSSALNW